MILSKGNFLERPQGTNTEEDSLSVFCVLRMKKDHQEIELQIFFTIWCRGAMITKHHFQ